jgi:uncharacterized protein DUF4019
MKRPPKGRWVALALGMGLGALLWGGPLRAEEPSGHAAEVSAATEQAAAWLGALDAERYDQVWMGLARVMKQGSSQDDWSKDVSSPRKQFGKPMMRDLRQAEFATVVRGAPTGRYVVAVYLTQFANAPPILETVLLMDEDGRWLVAGYSVGRAPEATAPAAPAPDSAVGAKPGT